MSKSTNPYDMNTLPDAWVTQEIDDALAAIEANDTRQQPIVDENTFINQIIPLLVHPWKEENLVSYKRFVKELHQPLRVAGIVDGVSKVLFTVPPLYQKPTTSMSAAGDVGVSHLLDYLARERERTPYQSGEVLNEFLVRITGSPITDGTLRPMALILAQYGRAFEDSDGNPLYSVPGGTHAKKHASSAAHADVDEGFESDGLIDED